jgi:hypothetical protein
MFTPFWFDQERAYELGPTRRRAIRVDLRGSRSVVSKKKYRPILDANYCPLVTVPQQGQGFGA